jgi:hypothetical protein
MWRVISLSLSLPLSLSIYIYTHTVALIYTLGVESYSTPNSNYYTKLRKKLLNQIARLLTGEHGSVIPGLSSVIVNQFGQ